MQRLSEANFEKIKRITLKTKAIIGQAGYGNTRSVRKGMGLDFESLREYSVGDDVRFIDWKASARTQSLLIKEFHQEQSLTIMIALDVSSSMNFGTAQQKNEVAAALASALLLIGHYAQDKVGLVIYSNVIHYAVPPAKGSAHINYLLALVMGWQKVSHKKTDSGVIIDFLLSLKTRKAFLFIVSDGLEEKISKTLAFLSRAYQVYMVHCYDDGEYRLPIGGWLLVCDSETRAQGYVSLNTQLNNTLLGSHELKKQSMQKLGICYLSVKSVDDGIDALVKILNVATV